MSALKVLREHLCILQSRWYDSWPPDVQQEVGRLIQRIDAHRPLGLDGKHGDLHTSTCGCDDGVGY